MAFPGKSSDCALGCEERKRDDIERRPKLGPHHDVPLLTIGLASEAALHGSDRSQLARRSLLEPKRQDEVGSL
jgi:hypothetical protein